MMNSMHCGTVAVVMTIVLASSSLVTSKPLSDRSSSGKLDVATQLTTPDTELDADTVYNNTTAMDEAHDSWKIVDGTIMPDAQDVDGTNVQDTRNLLSRRSSSGRSRRGLCNLCLCISGPRDSDGNCNWKYNSWNLSGSPFEKVYYVFAFLSSIAVFITAYRKLGLSWGVFFFALHPLDVASNWALFIFFAQYVTQEELQQAWGFILFIAICSTFLLVPVMFVQARRIGLPVSEVLPSCCGTWIKWKPSPKWSLGITILSLVFDTGMGAGAGVAIAINFAGDDTGEFGSSALLVTSAVLSLVSFGTELLFLCRLWEPRFRKGSCYADWVHSWLCYFDCCDVTEVFDLEAGEDRDVGLYCKNGGPTANHQSGPNGEGAFENGLCACKEADCANALYFYSCTPCCWSEYADIIKETDIGDPAEFWWCIYCGFDALSILQVWYRSEFKQLYGMPNNMCVNVTEIWCCRGCAIVQMAEHARMYPRDKINHDDKNFNWHKNKPVVHVEPKVEAEEYFGGFEGEAVEQGKRQSSKKKTSAEETQSSGFKKADVGKRVTVQGYDGVKGVIRFVGKHAIEKTARVGVELDKPVGKSNGTVKGHAYFECLAKRGVLVKPEKVQLVGKKKKSNK